MKWVRVVAAIFRAKFHPLHNLRRSKFYQRFLRHAFDFPIKANLGFRHPVHIRFLTHFSYLFLAREMEQSSILAFTKLSCLLDPFRQSVFDVGANIGLYSWCALDASPSLQVVLFEPDPRNFSLLKETARTWHANHAHLYCNPVSDECGIAWFSRDLLSSAAGTLDQGNLPFAQMHYQQQEEIIEVRKFQLDDLYGKEGILPPGLVKIDVEGHELEALRGASRTLEEFRPVLFVESFAEKSALLQEFLRNYGYTFFDADQISRVTTSTLNYLCVPSAVAPNILLALKGLGYPVDDC
jgi:FkbM family methyltransferase